MTEPRSLVIHVEANRKQHALKIIEHIINPALKDFGCVVQWPDQDEPEIAVAYDADDLREAFKR